MIASSTKSLICLLGLACLSTIGCGPKAAPMIEKVEGTLMRGQTPLVGVQVQFVPQVGPGVKAPTSSAVTDDKGFFRLMRDDNGKPGAAIGKHKIVLTSGRIAGGEPTDKDSDTAPVLLGDAVPSQYSLVTQTPLEQEVKADKNVYELVLP
jgi:hypothetical protein